MAQGKAPAAKRVDWVDYAKGWCIVLVVMMHSTLGVGEALGQEGWLHHFVAWARPFRMPDFFLVAGLFLSHTIKKDWTTFIDRKVLHFAYFYLLWLLIQSLLKFWPGAAATWPLGIERLGSQLAFGLIEPFGTLWFIYLLPIFFVVTKLLRQIPVWMVLMAGAVLQMAYIETGWTVIDEFAARYVYFFAGYAFAPQIFEFAAKVRGKAAVTLCGLVVWGILNGLAVGYGVAALAGVSLVLGFAGACAVIAFAVLLARGDLLPPLRYAGANSIVIYLAFFLPMAATRTVMLKLGVISDVGAVSLIVTGVAVATPLLLHYLVRSTPLRFLFERPALLRLRESPKATLMPAE